VRRFGAATRQWFSAAFAVPTEVQRRGWDAISSGEHALLIAPTGSGKTLAAFLWCIDQLARTPAQRAERPLGSGVRVLYLSPLKALVYDVERNLRLPLAGIAQVAEQRGETLLLPRVSVRTGDTSQKERREQARAPGEILVTTPESLYLLLGSRARKHLRAVEVVILDEVHALAGHKRGAHLSLSLERLSALCERDPQRIGLSATAQPLTEVARYLCGDRSVSIVDTSEPPRIDLQIVVPARDMTRPEAPPAERPAPDEPSSQLKERGMWPLIVPRLLELIAAHQSSILFVNSRGLCERLTHRLNELAGKELVCAHHGSLAHAERSRVEDLLKRGAIAGIVATSSLELGIDMGAVDLVLMVESPGSVARGLQRIGRAGHGVGQVSKGRLFPKHRGDLLEAAVIARRMGQGAIEALRVPENPLDVLAQQIVAMVAVEDWSLAALEAVVQRSANFHELPHSALLAVLDMLAGRYPSHRFGDLRPRIVWDRERDVLQARRGARMLAIVNGGTIPDRGSYSVHLGEDGPRVGELDEEMVHETTAGEVFTLGASSWRVEHITRDRVTVSPAPGEVGKLPFWRGAGPGRPLELGRALGAFVRELGTLPEARALAWLRDEHHLDELAARNLLDHVYAQRAATGCLPTDQAITVERFRDELGDFRVCILSPFGARVHAPWALALQAKLSAQSGIEVRVMHSDDGIALRFADNGVPPEAALLVPDPDEIEDLVVQQLASSALFAGAFRENAARALLLPRRHPGSRAPLWLQRRRSAELLAVARDYPTFPIILETYRSCLKDVFDLPALRELLAAIKRREVSVDQVDTTGPSPFARSLVFAYVASYLYDGDAPLAERRANALALDRRLLGELLGDAALRELLDPQVIAQVEAELQGCAEQRRARGPDGLHDLLRRVGELGESELEPRCEGSPAVLLTALERDKRAVRMWIAGEERVVAVEDVALLRDALGTEPPAGVPAVFLQPATEALEGLVTRYARTHGPFTRAELAGRYALCEAQLGPTLQALLDSGALVAGALRPGGEGEELCDVEVLRRIKRRTLVRLRAEAAPAPAGTLARFLPAWHGLHSPREGILGLQHALEQLEGLALPVSDLERAILPARVRDFAPAMLDELGATGWLCWVGAGALGAGDGKVALYRRDHVAALLEPRAAQEDLGPLARTLLAHLTRRGACFFAELRAACAHASSDELLAALHQLIWAGLVTNDTFEPLRSLRPLRSKSSRAQSRALAKAAGGRWSLVAELARGQPSPTERAHARSVKLLERHGFVTREVAALEEVPGGFAALYPVLSAMEEAGKIRRGYFVEDLGGAQFAEPGAVERLRALVQQPPGGALLLAAVDPANPFGWSLRWPDEPDELPDAIEAAASANTTKTRTPRRVAGAVLVLVDGAPVLYLGSGGKHLTSFPAARDQAALGSAVDALLELARRTRGKLLRVEQIDGERAHSSKLAPRLLTLRFTQAYRGLELEAR
jgi:ATP-dependent Lhr-like helicase